jgi:hypothetical protein
MIFTSSEIHCEAIRQDTASEHWDFKSKTVKVLNQNVYMQLQYLLPSGIEAKKMATHGQKVKCTDLTKWEWHYQMEPRVDPPSKQPIYIWYK